MNLKSRKFKTDPCYVCSYLFSDRHHLYPKAQFKAPYNRATITLCPNHHRYANILQTMLENKQTRDSIRSFAERYFDAGFNRKALDLLIDRYYAIEQAHNDLTTSAFDAMISMFEDMMGGLDDSRNSDHPDDHR